MPRRSRPDPLAARIGARIRTLRKEAGLTLRAVADKIDDLPVHDSNEGFFSFSYLSDIEKGLARPTVASLDQIAKGLGVPLLDLVTFPDEGDRQRLVDRSRHIPKGTIRKLLKEMNAVEKK